MFVGTVYCEFELSRGHTAFDGLRFLLVEPDHEVDFEGPCVVVDTVDAQVGEMVVVALAPLGEAFDIPDDLPILGAVVGVVGAMTAPADEDEAEPEERPRGRGRRGDAPKRDGARSDPPKRDARGGDAEDKRRAAPRKKVERKAPQEDPPEPTSASDSEVADKKPARTRKKTSKKAAPAKAAPAKAAPAKAAPAKAAPAKAAPAKAASDDDLQIVWEVPGGASAGDTTKRKAPRRRR